MNKIEKEILELLKQDLSQNEIAKRAGVPRSLVQKVSDRELGVSAASLKSLSEKDIVQIQTLSKEGTTNTALAEKFNVSTKTIARALLVRVSIHENNVTVISPKEGLGEDGEFDVSYDITPGGFAKILTEPHLNEIAYVGAFLEDRNQYLLLLKNNKPSGFKPFLAKRAQLEAVEADSMGLFPEDMTAISEIVEALVTTGTPVGNHYTVFVEVDGVANSLKGKINAKGQVGYLDAVTNMTVRVSMSLVILKTEALPEKEKVNTDESTKSKLKGVTLSKFLQEHQILLLPNQVVITKDGEPRTITTDHQFYGAIVYAIQDGDIAKAFELMEPRKAITKYSQGRLLIQGSKMTWEGHDVTGTGMAKRVLALAGRGDFTKMDRLTKFINKVFENPSAALVQSNRIYDFMAYSDIEIDEDGDILVYKSVRGNYMDKHSGTISNKPGTVVRMSRSFVNDNNTDLCSYGLHVCSLTYLRQCFGSNGQRVVRCKLNPKDIVSITNDYGNSKIRCCEYLVLDDYTTQYNRQYQCIDMKGIYRD